VDLFIHLFFGFFHDFFDPARMDKFLYGVAYYYEYMPQERLMADPGGLWFGQFLGNHEGKYIVACYDAGCDQIAGESFDSLDELKTRWTLD